jgi:hypothetical protein
MNRAVLDWFGTLRGPAEKDAAAAEREEQESQSLSLNRALIEP